MHRSSRSIFTAYDDLCWDTYNELRTPAQPGLGIQIQALISCDDNPAIRWDHDEIYNELTCVYWRTQTLLPTSPIMTWGLFTPALNQSPNTYHSNTRPRIRHILSEDRDLSFLFYGASSHLPTNAILKSSL